MRKTSETVVFFGSGPVAAESLRRLAEAYTIEAVITKPRPAHHHGDVPVLELAEKLRLKTYTVSNRRELDGLFDTSPVHGRLGVLIDFGIIVSQKVINYFPLGIVNSHFSILPEWRGADPITFAILSGQAQTGVSLMLLVEKMDEGPLLAYGEHDIEPTETTPQLTEYLIHLSDALLKHELPRYLGGETHGMPQDITGREVSYSRKLTKEDGLLDWRKPASLLEREVRAFTGWPKSRTKFGGLEVIITKAQVVDAQGGPGSTTILNKKPLVYCGEQALILDRVKPAGKQEMTGEGFLAGYRAQFLGS